MLEEREGRGRSARAGVQLGIESSPTRHIIVLPTQANSPLHWLDAWRVAAVKSCESGKSIAPCESAVPRERPSL